VVLLFLRLRFLVYGAVVGFAAIRLLGGGGPPPTMAESVAPWWLEGRALGGNVRLALFEGEPTYLGLHVFATCRSGLALYDIATFVDRPDRRWQRSGRSFSDTWSTRTWEPGEVMKVVTVRMAGSTETDGRAASGTFEETVRTIRGGQLIDACSTRFPWRVRRRG